MQKRPLISRIAAGALACAGALCALSAQAGGSYFAVVPVSGSGAVGQLRPVTLALAGATPPAATVGVPYEFNLGELLSLDGPAGTSPDNVSWGILSGKLPTGLELTANRISGVPAEVFGPGMVTIHAEYQDVGAMQVYAFEVRPTTIADFGGYRAWEGGTLAQSCEGYIRPAAAEHIYAGATGDGVYRISPAGIEPFDVHCDMSTDGGGWTLLMKQAKGDGTTLQGDTTYWKTGITLNDNTTGRSMSDGNFVSAAFAALPTSGFRLQAANEAEMRYHENTERVTGLVAFSDGRRASYSDEWGVFEPARPNWFVHADSYPISSAYPSPVPIATARFGFNFGETTERMPGANYCGARWGWAANEENPAYKPFVDAGQYVTPNGESYLRANHDVCGGLGGWGDRYGREHMNFDKSIWQPATLYLWGR